MLKTATPADYPAIAQLIETSFATSDLGYHDEAELVVKIRQLKNFNPALEIVAVVDDKIVGHGLLSDVTIRTEQPDLPFVGLVLAPLSIDPAFQRQGLGTKIIAELETRAKKLNCPYISILGHPTYYSKFGYVPAASRYGITAPLPVPDDVFLIKPLFKDALKNKSGALHYSTAFD